MRDWLIRKRKAANLSQQMVAQKCGITQQAYSHIETGIRRPMYETAQKIAETLDCDWTLFFEGEETALPKGYNGSS